MNLPAPLITFDEATHTYSVGGQLLPIQGITNVWPSVILRSIPRAGE